MAWKKDVSEMGMPFDHEAYEIIEGLGDFGMWLTEIDTVRAFRGNLMINLSARVAADRDMREASVELTRHALARID